MVRLVETTCTIALRAIDLAWGWWRGDEMTLADVDRRLLEAVEGVTGRTAAVTAIICSPWPSTHRAGVGSYTFTSGRIRIHPRLTWRLITALHGGAIRTPSDVAKALYVRIHEMFHSTAGAARRGVSPVLDSTCGTTALEGLTDLSVVRSWTRVVTCAGLQMLLPQLAATSVGPSHLAQAIALEQVVLALERVTGRPNEELFDLLYHSADVAPFRVVAARIVDGLLLRGDMARWRAVQALEWALASALAPIEDRWNDGTLAQMSRDELAVLGAAAGRTASCRLRHAIREIVASAGAERHLAGFLGSSGTIVR